MCSLRLLVLIVILEKCFYVANAYRRFTHTVAYMKSCCPFISKHGGVMLLGGGGAFLKQMLASFIYLHGSIYYFYGLQAWRNHSYNPHVSRKVHGAPVFFDIRGDVVCFLVFVFWKRRMCRFAFLIVDGNHVKPVHCFFEHKWPVGYFQFSFEFCPFFCQIWVAKFGVANCANKIFQHNFDIASWHCKHSFLNVGMRCLFAQDTEHLTACSCPLIW